MDRIFAVPIFGKSGPTGIVKARVGIIAGSEVDHNCAEPWPFDTVVVHIVGIVVPISNPMDSVVPAKLPVNPRPHGQVSPQDVSDG